jgi:hypothetical protein
VALEVLTTVVVHGGRSPIGVASVCGEVFEPGLSADRLDPAVGD